MKKFALLSLIAILAAFSAPAFAMTNPFMDVPMNHWAYDAIGQLAAHGILAGYPDGTYKGQQQTTRYELASSLARSLAVVDMTKASKQDVEMMKRLVVEFRDELEALGVRVDELDERVQVLEDRLGGWHIHGHFWFDIAHDANKGRYDGHQGENKTEFEMHYIRLFFERRFGEAEEMHFVARLGQDHPNTTAAFQRFYVEMPFFFDSTLTVGRFLWEYGVDYRPWASWLRNLADSGSIGYLDVPFTDRTVQGIGVTKNFGIGNFRAYAAHNDVVNGGLGSSWELSAFGQLQFTEKFGFDIGGIAFIGDNAEKVTYYKEDNTTTTNAAEATRLEGESFGSIWSIYAGLRYNFNENISFRGMFAHEKIKREETYVSDTDTNTYSWRSQYSDGASRAGQKDDPNHWRVIFTISQAALKFTSAWLEYGQYDAGFTAARRTGMGGFLFGAENQLYGGILPDAIDYDVKYLRVILSQQWNETWGTHLYYYGYTFSDVEKIKDQLTEDAKISEIGVGVRYRLNPAVVMGLNYEHVDNDNYYGNDFDEDNLVKFRTEVWF